ncbi:copper transporter [Nocardia camponoti]
MTIATGVVALAVGVALGSHTLGADLLADLDANRDQTRTELVEAHARADSLQVQVAAADAFIAGSAARVLGGTLADRSVLMFTTPDADPADIDGVNRALTASGATVTGRIGLTESFIDTAQSDRMRSTLTNVVPAGAQLRTDAIDEPSLAGDLLGVTMLLDPTTNQPRATAPELALVATTLRDGGFLTYADAPTKQANLAVVVTGAGVASDTDAGVTIARFAASIRARAMGTVLAGRLGAAEGNGPIALVRAAAPTATTVTTVDNIDHEIGRVTTILALSQPATQEAGRFGTGPAATTITLVAAPR